MRIFLIVLGAVISLTSVSPEQEPWRKKVLIIGIDGCRPDALLKAKTPHLEELIRHGGLQRQGPDRSRHR